MANTSVVVFTYFFVIPVFSAIAAIGGKMALLICFLGAPLVLLCFISLMSKIEGKNDFGEHDD